jgi:hypothetical protein
LINLPREYAFLERMDFFKTVGAQLPNEGKFKRYDPRGRFVPVTQVGTSNQVHQIADEIVTTLRVDDVEAQRVLRHCVGELVDNVFVHAASPCDAIVCAQHFPNARRTQVAIVDAGIGFRRSFEESGVFGARTLSDKEAILLGCAPYVTSKPTNVRDRVYTSGHGYGRLGIGLFIVSETLAQVGGRLLLASGGASLNRRGARVKWATVRPWQGAIVGFEVPDDPWVSYQEALRNARRMAQEQRLD